MKIRYQTLTTIGVVAVTISAAAAERHWYVALEGGQVSPSGFSTDSVGDHYSDLVSSITSQSSSVGKKGTGWSVLAGYSISEYFALQAGYVDLGNSAIQYNAEYTTWTGIPPRGYQQTFSATASLASAGWTIAGQGQIPFGKGFDVHGQMGALKANTALVSQNAYGTFSFTTPESNSSSVSWLYGVGVGYKVMHDWSLNLDWRRYNGVGDEMKTMKLDYDLASLGVVFHF